MQRVQVIETQMKLHIVRCDSSKTMESLEGNTFGQILTVFRRHSQDQVLNDWLNSMRVARNDVAHTYFRNTELMKREYGPVVARLNHGVLRKMLRMSSGSSWPGAIAVAPSRNAKTEKGGTIAYAAPTLQPKELWSVVPEGSPMNV
jgi:hypothetical protein